MHEYADAIVASVASVVDRLIDRVAEEQGVDPKVARSMVLLWAEIERDKARRRKS
jgi:hypothetical protein